MQSTLQWVSLNYNYYHRCYYFMCCLPSFHHSLGLYMQSSLQSVSLNYNQMLFYVLSFLLFIIHGDSTCNLTLQMVSLNYHRCLYFMCFLSFFSSSIVSLHAIFPPGCKFELLNCINYYTMASHHFKGTDSVIYN